MQVHTNGITFASILICVYAYLKYLGCDIKLRLELSKMWNNISLPLLSGPLCPREVVRISI